MPETGASQVIDSEHRRVLGSERPVGQDPFDAGDGILPKPQILPCESCPQLGFEQVGGYQASEVVQPPCVFRRTRFVEGDGRQH